MTRDEIGRKILGILWGQGLIGEGKEVPETIRFKEDLDFDSLNSVEVIMEIEDAFGITIADDDAKKLLTIGQAIDRVNVIPSLTSLFPLFFNPVVTE